MQVSSPLRVMNPERPGMGTNQLQQSIFVLPRTRAFPFFSQENFFSRPKNKIHFFLVDFETDF